jgi:hypothetical protein
MRIDKVIFASDDNPKYYDFWTHTSEVCLTALGITPVLFHITDEDTDFVPDDFGLRKKFKAVEGIDTGFQSQIIRMYGTKFLPNEVCLTADIDMFLMNRSYFVDGVMDLDDDDLALFGADAYGGCGRYPLCYNAAQGKVFDQVLDFDCSFEEYTRRLLAYDLKWDTDELYFGACVDQKPHGVAVRKLPRGWERGRAVRRIDRAHWVFDQEKVLNDFYIDCHSKRPYGQFKDEIDFLKGLILAKCR